MVDGQVAGAEDTRPGRLFDTDRLVGERGAARKWLPDAEGRPARRL